MLISTLRRKWQGIAERAEKIKGHGKIKRLLTSDADAKALQGLVDEMNRSIQVDMVSSPGDVPSGPATDAPAQLEGIRVMEFHFSNQTSSLT